MLYGILIMRVEASEHDAGVLHSVYDQMRHGLHDVAHESLT